jgi:hypothetical protein
MTVYGTLVTNAPTLTTSALNAAVLLSPLPQCTCGRAPNESHAHGVAAGDLLVLYPYPSAH